MKKRTAEMLVTVARLKAKAKSEKIARKLLAAEMERRLEGLNHEAERLKVAQAVSVTRELFDAKQGELRRWQDTINARMAAYAGAAATLAFLLDWFLHK